MRPRANTHRSARRNFFKKAALLGGSAVLTILGKRARARTSLDPPAQARQRGYRLTAHIRKYYEKASL